MKEYFNDIKGPIDKDKILQHFSEHEIEREEKNNGESDPNAKHIIGLLKNDKSLSYWKCTFSEQTIEKLRLPYHIHNNKGDNSGIELIGQNGTLLNDFYLHYEKFKNNPKKKECIDKINNIKEIFFNGLTDLYNANFVLLSNDGNLVHKGNYVGNYINELFIANGFHRLAAYSLTLRELGRFIPIEVYYGHNEKLVGKNIKMTR